jgi:hypothetical protein
MLRVGSMTHQLLRRQPQHKNPPGKESGPKGPGFEPPHREQLKAQRAGPMFASSRQQAAGSTKIIVSIF